MQVRSTFLDEGVRHEQGFILPTSDGAVLVWAAELGDPNHANRAFARSTHPIDAEHEKILTECLAERIELLPTLDVALVLESA